MNTTQTGGPGKVAITELIPSVIASHGFACPQQKSTVIFQKQNVLGMKCSSYWGVQLALWWGGRGRAADYTACYIACKKMPAMVRAAGECCYKLRTLNGEKLKTCVGGRWVGCWWQDAVAGRLQRRRRGGPEEQEEHARHPCGASSRSTHRQPNTRAKLVNM